MPSGQPAAIMTKGLVVYPARKWARGRSRILAGQGGGRRRAVARQGQQRCHAEISPGIWF